MTAPTDAAVPVSALEALDAATAAIAGEVSLEGVLQVIADRLRPLVGASHAALGIVGPDRRIARFICSTDTRPRPGLARIPLSCRTSSTAGRTNTWPSS